MGRQYQIYNESESMCLSATSNLRNFVPQSYLFAHYKTPVKFAFWNPNLGPDQQTGIIPDGGAVSLVAWIPNSNKPGFVCIRDGGNDYEILPSWPSMDKIAKFKIHYLRAREVPLTREEQRRVEEEQRRAEEERRRVDKEGLFSDAKMYKIKDAILPEQSLVAKDGSFVTMR